MKRKVKSWEDLLLIGRKKSGSVKKGTEVIECDLGQDTFTYLMRDYCGKEIEIINGFHDHWRFEEWMLESATKDSLREAVQDVIEVLEGGGVPNTTYILNRLKTVLND